MNPSPSPTGLLARFAERFGASSTGPSDSGVFTIDGHFRLSLSADETGKTLLILCELDDFAVDSSLHEDLLRMNFVEALTRGITFTLRPASDRLILALREPLADLDDEGLVRAVEVVLDAADRVLAAAAQHRESRAAFGENIV
jgi:hypothetical protein